MTKVNTSSRLQQKLLLIHWFSIYLQFCLFSLFLHCFSGKSLKILLIITFCHKSVRWKFSLVLLFSVKQQGTDMSLPSPLAFPSPLSRPLLRVSRIASDDRLPRPPLSYLVSPLPNCRAKKNLLCTISLTSLLIHVISFLSSPIPKNKVRLLSFHFFLEIQTLIFH